MYRRMITTILFAFYLVGATTLVTADEIKIDKSDKIEDILSKQVGKHVTLTLESGMELSGIVTAVTKELVHLSELTGKEFYDAVITTEQVEAVVIRTK